MDDSGAMTTEAVLARCSHTLGRVEVGEVDVAAVAEFIVDLRRVPEERPERARLAAGMVGALVERSRTAWTRVVPMFGDLLALADPPPPGPEWPVVRAGARAAYLAHCLMGLPDLDLVAAEQEAAELVATTAGSPRHHVFAVLAQEAVKQSAATRDGDESVRLRSLDRLTALLTLSDDDPRRELIDHLRAGLVANQSGDGAEVVRRLRMFTEAHGENPIGDGMQAIFADALAKVQTLATVIETPSTERIQAEIVRLRADSVGVDDDWMAAKIATTAMLFRFQQETDLGRVEQALDECRELVAAGQSRFVHPYALAALAFGLLRRAELADTVDGLDEAQAVLLDAKALINGPQSPLWPLVNDLLSHVGHYRGDHGAAAESGVEGQLRYVVRALLESDTAGAKVAIADAVGGAVRYARGFLLADRVEDALRVLDTGRGLMLFAEVLRHDLPDRLTAAGRIDLARRWAAGEDESPALRDEVVTALLGLTGLPGDPLRPPALTEITAALRATEADAFVYLVPGGAGLPGLAVVAPAEGPPGFVVLPDLHVAADTEVERYLAALANRSRELGPVDGEFADRVDALCDWAWRAAIGPLLESFATRTGGAVPHLVLVPMGDLARVPWQAARRPDGTHAVELAAFSLAVSARLFCLAAARTPVPPSSNGLIVADPDTGGAGAPLVAARREAHEVRQAFYRDARYIGRGGPAGSDAGTVAQVRAWLTDQDAGSMLHLACHGTFTTDPGGTTASLLLAPDESGAGALTADEIVRLLASVPERDLGLVVMAACHTGRSIHGYDEAYSLGTAFLAAGARTVLSTQWAIPDESTSSLMYLFHHFHREEGLAPWRALRAAQLRMLDPSLPLPEHMPDPLRVAADNHVVSWAGFVHSGQ
ncbi:CHAT domain-containing protein [Actinokineospora globicatena]|uniref:CHAT domain-containing protein n=1 Tax=Actinokineospora globicatena TaxID=103729 RepID=UPI0020A2BB1F|nr:CHAT domain-containing protein [Actinokineospora globicatena]MCP2303122.1 CHAT domain-containing protein [Actinokineospora globicatena]GLW79764.1 hypothetical protein Aglo01_42450 [Actinokineospora globicatena]GLW85826.1 hypothetical protein Aglo02_34660 [Actinokineospora globicatena]